MIRPLRRLLALPAAVFASALLSCIQPLEFTTYTLVVLEPGPDLEFRAREALIAATPGTIIEFPEGTFAFTDELTVDVSHVTLRGQGPDRTTLDFSGQQTGAQGILATADAFTMQDLRVLDPEGDGVRVEGADGVVFQNVHVEWSGEPSAANGAYGLYPVQSRNVLIEGCYVRGASDAGIYVGQSQHIIVRRSRAVDNVAGIEIENSQDADVYHNEMTGNTGGLLVFDLPGLPNRGCRAHVDPLLDEPDCRGTRAFGNWIHDNNRENFGSGIVGMVPPGTGVIVLATDGVEITDNVITHHGTAGIAIASYLLTQLGWNDPGYDPYPERVYVHGNEVRDVGYDPKGDLGIIANIFFNPFGGIPDIAYDGFIDGAKADGDGRLPLEIGVCIGENAGDGEGGLASFGSMNGLEFPPLFDLAPHTCTHPAKPPTAEVAFAEPPEVEPPYTPEEIEALCQPGADPSLGVNWAAFVVDCPNLADYRLFADPTEPRRDPNPGGVPFDLTTPLFSDYAQKDRFVFVPPGETVTYRDPEAFDFPVGTIIAKSFGFAADLRDPSSPEKLVETRLLIRRADGWHGAAWIWNEAGTNAELALGGGVAPVSWIHTDGSLRETDYQIPNTHQCDRCHPGNGPEPIGPTARMLNRAFDYGGGLVENQLVHWTDLGLLVGAPADPAAAPRVPVWNDPADGTLDERARGYLEGNCAHCHAPGGRAGSTGLLLEYARPLGAATGVCKTPVAAGGGASGGLTYDIVPGDPDASILLHRMLSVEAQVKMPELSRSVVHEEGVALVRAWIESLPGACP